jgi:hypothetical protein
LELNYVVDIFLNSNSVKHVFSITVKKKPKHIYTHSRLTIRLEK